MEKITAAQLTDMGICPTCYNREHGYALFGDETEQTLFENDLFKCILIREPRTEGHTVIVSQAHYKDMMDIPDELCREIYSFARRAMIVLREVYHAESVYLCTMQRRSTRCGYLCTCNSTKKRRPKDVSSFCLIRCGCG